MDHSVTLASTWGTETPLNDWKLECLWRFILLRGRSRDVRRHCWASNTTSQKLCFSVSHRSKLRRFSLQSCPTLTKPVSNLCNLHRQNLPHKHIIHQRKVWSSPGSAFGLPYGLPCAPKRGVVPLIGQHWTM